MNGWLFFFSSRRRHTRSLCDWSSDVCSSDLLVAELRRADPHRPVALVRRQPLEQLRQLALERALERERVEMDAEALQRRLDRVQHLRNRVALVCGELADVVAAVAVLRRLLAAPRRLDRRPEQVELPSRVVVVVLAL